MFIKIPFLCFLLLAVVSSLSVTDAKAHNAPERKQLRKLSHFNKEGVYFSNLANGTRLNKVTKLSREHYEITISSEFIPTNSSSFFAFQLWADEKKTIKISLKYTEYKHRYIPKLSEDGLIWRPIKGLILSESDTTATFDITLSSKKLWLSAQEIESSEHTYEWLDKFISNKSYIRKHSVGKTVLKQDLFVVSSEQESVKPSVVLIARQHPPEIPGGVIAFKAFFEEVMGVSNLAQNFRKEFNIYAFPLLNPDGADNGNWRHNSNGKDLNRDWEAFTQPETLAVKNFVIEKVKQENKSIWFGIDFHTSYNGPYLLILNEENEQMAKTRIIPRLINNINDQTPIFNQYRRRDQDLPYCYNWFYKAFGSEAITYEEGDETDRSIIKARARLYAKSLMQQMLLELKLK
ncbi:M14 family metallopeptidase [Thalassotalea fonticola]|uniref:M14 family metallopeptidase n=1 Tax=Thalassotalea fonticola TaxID=3065649 RepID=A0ABZ0GK86_9GAMM|nr:M14 family metallopeptidase [Colwelliaceae bacterium S1-1]